MPYSVYSPHQAYRIAKSQRIAIEKKMMQKHHIVKVPASLKFYC